MPRYELMEARTLLSTVNWVGSNTGGDWDVAANWLDATTGLNHVPTASDAAVVNLTAAGTVTLNGSVTDTANSLTTNANSSISISGDTLSLASTSTIGGGLALDGGTLTGAGTLTVTGATTWAGGTMSGTGVTNAEGGLTLGMATGGGSFQDFLNQRTLNNAGAAVIQTVPTGSYTYLYMASGALVDNQPGASFAFANDSTYVQSNGGTPAGGTFLDAGSVTKAGSTGLSSFGSGVTFNVTGTGTVAVNSGELSIQGDGTDSTASPITVAAGATLDFGGGTYTIAASSGISGVGSGVASFSSGTVNDDGSYNVTGTTVIPAGTLNYSGAAAATTGTLNLDGGTLTGPSVFTVTGATTWNGGTISGSGVTNAEGGLTLGMATGGGSFQDFLNQRTLNNAGAAVIQKSPTGSYTYLYLASGALFDNQPGASFAFANDSTYVQSNGGTPAGGTFLDEGSVTKAGTTGASVFSSDVTFNVTGTGTVAVNSGELSIQGGGTDSTASPMTIAAAATLDFGGGTYTFAASSGISGVGAGVASFSGGTVNDAGGYSVAGTTSATGGTANLTGSIALVGATVSIPGGTLNLSGTGSAPLPTTTLTLSGGTLTGSNTLTVTGATTWTGGTMSGTGVTNAEGGLTLGMATGGGSFQDFLTQRTLNNSGAAVIQNSPTGSYTYLYLTSGALFDNQPGASFAFANDSTYVQSNGGTSAGGTFLNEGSVTKAGSTGSSFFGGNITFNVTGTGTVAVNSGELSIQGGGTDSTASPMTIAAAATLDFGGGTYTFAASSGISGVGGRLGQLLWRHGQRRGLLQRRRDHRDPRRHPQLQRSRSGYHRCAEPGRRHPDRFRDADGHRGDDLERRDDVGLGRHQRRGRPDPWIGHRRRQLPGLPQPADAQQRRGRGDPELADRLLHLPLSDQRRSVRQPAGGQLRLRQRLHLRPEQRRHARRRHLPRRGLGDQGGHHRRQRL